MGIFTRMTRVTDAFPHLKIPIADYEDKVPFYVWTMITETHWTRYLPDNVYVVCKDYNKYHVLKCDTWFTLKKYWLFGSRETCQVYTELATGSSRLDAVVNYWNKRVDDLENANGAT